MSHNLQNNRKNNVFNILSGFLPAYCRDRAGAIAIMFAFMAPVIIGSAGFALDYAQAYLVQQRLSQAIDAAALAGAASSDDEDAIEEKVKEFFDKNYPPEKLGVTFEPKVRVDGDKVYVTGTAYHATTMLRILGIDKIDVEAKTTVNREVRAIEVALVLDNTGSMSTNNNIRKLKEAAQEFVRIMFDAARNDNLVRIGLVPYANAVRVGSYGLGKNPDGTQYADGEKFVNLPVGWTTTTNHRHTNQKQWFGCVIESNPNGWNPKSKTNDPYPRDVLDNYEGPWDVYDYETSYSSSYNKDDPDMVCLGNKTNCYKHQSHNNPTQNCPYAQIVPLTSDRDKLVAAIGNPQNDTDGMRAYGNTLGNIGMAWGARLISPEKPFTEGSEWDNLFWKKAIIMMTDGVNTNDSHYSAFWRRKNHQLDTADYDNKFAETCEALKEKGVIIYTITFGNNNSIPNTLKGYYRDCASSEDKYTHTNNQDVLVAIFQRIARELSILHISD